MTDTQLIYANWAIATATIAAALAAIASAFYARKAISNQQENFGRQLEEYRLALAAETALKLEAKFNDPLFKDVRSRAAKALYERQNEVDAEDVFDFFNTVGKFVQLGALDENIAYSLFFHWINLYWRAGKHHIGAQQTDTSAVWRAFEFLYNRMCEIEKGSHSDSEDLRMPEARLRQQLEEEFLVHKAVPRR
jgi:spore maturation protein CgeB